MPRPEGSKNKNAYPEHRHVNFYWGIVDASLSRELQAFKGAHNRVLAGKSPSIYWPRTLDGFVGFMKAVGRIPKELVKPSLGRKKHALGYEPGNVVWEEHSFNSIKRRGTRYES